MSTSIELLGPAKVWTPPASQPFNETAWQAWISKGRAHDRRGDMVRVELVSWISIAALLVTAALWSQVAPYDMAVRFTVSAGAIVLLVHEFRAGHEVFAVVFGWLALMYNPVAPMFSISDGWQRAFVVASAAPFAASLAWRNLRSKQND